ncbi:MAG: hypothetical protein QNJ45_28555 [Ardenticatenaceae bacterium]|nr:hypothetical protein [Ardenticatenaceae bacterium]
MNNLQMIEQEKSVLQWGGLAGILGGILFILSMVVAEGLIPSAPANPTELVARFPDIHLLRIAENGLYLTGLILGVPLFLTLLWTLWKTGLAPALFGSALGIVGLISMAISATPHVAHYPISELYQTVGATPATQETLGFMWEATWGVFNAPLYVGFFVGMIGFTLIGVSMLASSTFGKGLSWMIVVVGAAGVVAAFLQMVDPASVIGVVPFFAYIIFYFVLGGKIYSVSKTA